MLIIVYLIVVVIVVLLLVVFNVRSSKKKRSASSVQEAEDEMTGSETREAAAPIGGSVAAVDARADSDAVADAEADATDADIKEGEPETITEKVLETATAGLANFGEERRTDRGSSPGTFAKETLRTAEPSSGRRDPSGKDMSFRGALRDMSAGDKRQDPAPASANRSERMAITDNDYRNALRHMKQEDRDKD